MNMECKFGLTCKFSVKRIKCNVKKSTKIGNNTRYASFRAKENDIKTRACNQGKMTQKKQQYVNTTLKPDSKILG